ncbi:hypothetical protein I5E68_07260 [Novosphingobium sp. YJ-S2-02]|uniref:Uncharacterized protein n=1 Tax=Novosphingobium aureum TaxID=2792964 RepID=A0A931MKR9_9SPHN|nr:hypothetical protein [Novosphingobium aureum]MBH0112749.1 hypothetical protein [Novosphingobium aureum]
MTDRVYYEVEPGSEALKFCQRYAADLQAAKNAYADFAKKHGAKGWTEGFTRLAGLVFDFGATIPSGFKKERRRTSDGQDVYTPRLRGSEHGKAIAKQIEALPALPSQNAFATTFGIPTSLTYAGGDCVRGCSALTIGVVTSALIGWSKPGAYRIVLPDIDARIAEAKERYDTVEPSSWTLPEGLTRSSKARYDLAFAQAKVEQEEAA